ncbi:ankyrin repeat domain-containing protein [Pseudoalteromonas atlantica]|uniref:ankyrin repeat domain-containing protein n=1 Tax=Pseudoalteromonas atlantica TaxID=288 RepID=UPI0037368181
MMTVNCSLLSTISIVCLFFLIGCGDTKEEFLSVEPKGQTLVKNGHSINHRLAKAINESDKEAFNAALEEGADPNAKLDNGGSPLSLSTINFDHYYFNELLKAGGDPNLYKDSANKNLIFEVLGPDRREHLRVLLKFNPNLDVKDGVDSSPLIYAAIISNYESMKILIEYGADKTAVNRFGYSALDVIKDNATRECLHNECPLLNELKELLEKSRD